MATRTSRSSQKTAEVRRCFSSRFFSLLPRKACDRFRFSCFSSVGFAFTHLPPPPTCASTPPAPPSSDRNYPHDAARCGPAKEEPKGKGQKGNRFPTFSPLASLACSLAFLGVARQQSPGKLSPTLPLSLSLLLLSKHKTNKTGSPVVRGRRRQRDGRQEELEE